MLLKTGAAMTQNKKPHCGITHKHGSNSHFHSIKKHGQIDPLLLVHMLVLVVLALLILGGAA